MMLFSQGEEEGVVFVPWATGMRWSVRADKLNWPKRQGFYSIVVPKGDAQLYEAPPRGGSQGIVLIFLGVESI